MGGQKKCGRIDTLFAHVLPVFPCLSVARRAPVGAASRTSRRVKPFDFVPQVFWLCGAGALNYYSFILSRGSSNFYAGGNPNTALSWGEKTVTWTNEYGEGPQMNIAGASYSYGAIGE